MTREYFKVNVNPYISSKDFYVMRPASLNYPKDNAVMFIVREFIDRYEVFYKCTNCLVFWPEGIKIPIEVQKRHAVVPCIDPRKEYSRFYRDNGITYYPELERVEIKNGYYISPRAVVGENCHIFPGAYIGGEVEIGNNVYIGSGARLVGEVHIGNNVIIRENSVIGADGLSTDRDEDGRAVTMPQFGGVIIEDDVQIGAMTVIGRGAIDYTRIGRGSKIDNSSFISHNVQIGEDTFLVGGAVMFGSSSIGKQGYISGNATVRDGISIGGRAMIGMGSVVVKDVPGNVVVKGNPAK